MQSISNRIHSPTSTKRNDPASSLTQGISNEQLLTMATPQRINTLQWDLSSLGERRELLKNDAAQDQETAKTTGQPSAADTNTTVINQLRIKTLQINTAKNAAILTDTVVADNVLVENIYNEQVELDAITQQFQTRFAGSAENKTEFHRLMQKSFGAQYDVAKAETMRQQALKGDFSWMPKIQLVNGSQLADVSSTQGAGVGRGAYSQAKDTIFLSRDLLRSNPAMAEKILTEEIGHSIDARINVNDAKGDEGDIFSRLSHGEKISKKELAALQAENDSGTININGEKIEVEYGFFSRIKKFLKRIKNIINGSGANETANNGTSNTGTIDKTTNNETVDQGSTIKSVSSDVILRQGSRGKEVKLLQQQLQLVGFNPGTADGIFGAKTKSALVAFQYSHNLVADGIAGPNTWRALGVEVHSTTPEKLPTDGYFTDKNITTYKIPALERKNLAQPDAIIMHRTVTNTAGQAISSFKNGVGTHFLIGKDGTIFQTASLNKTTVHVGKIKSRTQVEGTWSKAEQKIIEGIGWAPMELHRYESKKDYPDRYPTNSDSIGIEVVSMYNEKTKTWDAPPNKQRKSIDYLVHKLQNQFNLDDQDIYKHDQVSYKTAGEGEGLYGD